MNVNVAKNSCLVEMANFKKSIFWREGTETRLVKTHQFFEKRLPPHAVFKLRARSSLETLP